MRAELDELFDEDPVQDPEPQRSEAECAQIDAGKADLDAVLESLAQERDDLLRSKRQHRPGASAWEVMGAAVAAELAPKHDLRLGAHSALLSARSNSNAGAATGSGADDAVPHAPAPPDDAAGGRISGALAAKTKAVERLAEEVMLLRADASDRAAGQQTITGAFKELIKPTRPGLMRQRNDSTTPGHDSFRVAILEAVERHRDDSKLSSALGMRLNIHRNPISVRYLPPPPLYPRPPHPGRQI
jgi:hypothetical protein